MSKAKTKRGTPEFGKAIKGIIEQFQGAQVAHGGKSSIPKTEFLTTGLVGLDDILGGGIPAGTWCEIWGPEASGKTTLSLQILAAGQKLGETVAFIDMEHRLPVDPSGKAELDDYARKLGLVHDDSSFFGRPPDGEDAFEWTRRLIEAGANRIVIDSLAALTTKSEGERTRKKGFTAAQQPGEQARLLAYASRIINPVLSGRRCFVLYTNQVRANLSPFGSSETVPGGRAVKHFQTQRMRISRDGKEEAWGFYSNVDVRKNRQSRPHEKWRGRMVFGHGFDAEYDLLTVARRLEVVEQRGNWYMHEGQQLGVGLEKASATLREDHQVCEAILAGVIKAMALPRPEPQPEPDMVEEVNET